MILVRVSPHQGLDLLEQQEALVFFQASGGPEDRLAVLDGGVEVGVEHDLTRDREVLAITCGSTASGGGGGEVEGGLGAGEVAEGLGPAHVQRLGRSEGFLYGCAVGEGVVEVEGVGEVELGLEPHGPGEVDVVVVHGRMPRVHVQVPVLGIRSRVDLTQLETFDGVGDEAVELRGTDLPRDRGDLDVDVTSGFTGEGGGGVDGDLGDPTGPPGRHEAGLDLGPESGEAVT